MKVGGYQIIDFENRELLTEEGQIFEGIYELIEGTTKPILFSGIKIDDVELHDTFVNIITKDGEFVAAINTQSTYYYIHISDRDVVECDVTP